MRGDCRSQSRTIDRLKNGEDDQCIAEYDIHDVYNTDDYSRRTKWEIVSDHFISGMGEGEKATERKQNFECELWKDQPWFLRLESKLSKRSNWI